MVQFADLKTGDKIARRKVELVDGEGIGAQPLPH
jgi:hypothetical protein